MCLLPVFFRFDCDAWNSVALYISCVALLFLRLLIVAFRKTSEQRWTLAGWRAWPWRVYGSTVVYVGVRTLFLKFWLSASFWELRGKLLRLCSARGNFNLKRWIVGILQLGCTVLSLYGYCIFITTIAPQGDAFQKGTWGVYTCCIAVRLFGGVCSCSVPCIAPL